MKNNSKINNSKIKSLRAREIIDSRGNPTLEVELATDLGLFLASVPSGASKGKYEAVELRDGGKRYQGRGVLKAVKNVNEIIAPKLKGKDPTRQKEIDNLMIKLDGTKNKAKLGVNAILAVSMAVCRAGASAKNLHLYRYIRKIFNFQFPRLPSASLQANGGQAIFNLPKPCFNVINGGAHAGNELDFQEFMIVPQEKQFSKNLQVAIEIYHQLKNLIKEKYINLGINLGDEGGFAPPARTSEEALDLILKAVKNLGYQNKIKIMLDLAASQFFIKDSYQMRIGVFNRERLINYYSDLIQKYPILGLEDPFSEDDWEGWKKLMSKVPEGKPPHIIAFGELRGGSASYGADKSQESKVLIIGDDLLATNSKRIKMAKEENACNSAIIKLNQIGTITETLEAAELAKSFGWKIIVSHRSGETNDDFISDLAVGMGADFIKAGGPARGERVAKYNRLLKIEEEISGRKK